MAFRTLKEIKALAWLVFRRAQLHRPQPYQISQKDSAMVAREIEEA